MQNFDFYAPTRIVFGKDKHNQIGALLKPYTAKVLLHYGGQSCRKSGLLDAVISSLKENGIEYVELGGVEPNPRLSLAREGIVLCRRERVTLVLAVGGGSVIDSAKSIAMGVDYSGDVWEIYEQYKPVKQALPVAVILTLPASGSEASGDAVLSNAEQQLKLGYSSPALRPLLSVINPELFFTLPENQIANGIMDMMSHVMERYFTNTLHTDLTDALCESVLKTIIKNAPLILANPMNYDAWCEVAFSGMIAHNGLLGMGRRTDWACHFMEHELSAVYDIAHGAGLAVLTPYWMKYVYRDNINMFVQFAVNVLGVEVSYRDPESIVAEGIARLQSFLKQMKLPQSLTKLGIDGSQLQVMAQKATGADKGTEKPLGGLKKLNWQDVLAIYKAAQ